MPDAPRTIHLLVLNEFFHPDVCASSAVLTDQLPRIARLRPDWRITVLTGNRAWDRPDIRWPDRDQFGTIQIVRVPRPASGRTLVRRAMGFAGFHWGVMSRGRRIDRPHVIMASTAPPLGGWLGARLARHFRCRLIYRILDLYPDCAEMLGVLRPGGFLARRWRRLDTAIMRRADAVVAISRGIAARIARERGIPPDAVCVIHDGFAPERIRPTPAGAPSAGAGDGPPGENPFRRECGLTGRFVVQYAGNMGLSHPFNTILAAARRLADDPAFVFQFIGAGPGRAAIDAAHRDLPERIQLIDYQPAERLPDVLTAADVALISQANGMSDLSLPYKLYGILAAGRPCIFVGPVASEIVALYREADCGMHVEQGDVDGLAAALRRLRADAALRDHMAANARKVFDERFSSQRAAEAWIELIERCAGASTSGCYGLEAPPGVALRS